MTFILSMLTSRLAGPAASIVAVILLALCVGQCTRAVKAEGRAAKAEKALAASERDVGTCRANLGALDEARKRQNAAVEGWKADGDRKAAEAEKAVQAARSEAARADRMAKALAAFKPTGPDLCARMLNVDEKVRTLQ